MDHVINMILREDRKKVIFGVSNILLVIAVDES